METIKIYNVDPTLNEDSIIQVDTTFTPSDTTISSREMVAIRKQNNIWNPLYTSKNINYTKVTEGVENTPVITRTITKLQSSIENIPTTGSYNVATTDTLHHIWAVTSSSPNGIRFYKQDSTEIIPLIKYNIPMHGHWNPGTFNISNNSWLFGSADASGILILNYDNATMEFESVLLSNDSEMKNGNWNSAAIDINLNLWFVTSPSGRGMRVLDSEGNILDNSLTSGSWSSPVLDQINKIVAIGSLTNNGIRLYRYDNAGKLKRITSSSIPVSGIFTKINMRNGYWSFTTNNYTLLFNLTQQKLERISIANLQNGSPSTDGSIWCYPSMNNAVYIKIFGGELITIQTNIPGLFPATYSVLDDIWGMGGTTGVIFIKNNKTTFTRLNTSAITLGDYSSTPTVVDNVWGFGGDAIRFITITNDNVSTIYEEYCNTSGSVGIGNTWLSSTIDTDPSGPETPEGGRTGIKFYKLDVSNIELIDMNSKTFNLIGDWNDPVCNSKHIYLFTPSTLDNDGIIKFFYINDYIEEIPLPSDVIIKGSFNKPVVDTIMNIWFVPGNSNNGIYMIKMNDIDNSMSITNIHDDASWNNVYIDSIHHVLVCTGLIYGELDLMIYNYSSGELIHVPFNCYYDRRNITMKIDVDEINQVWRFGVDLYKIENQFITPLVHFSDAELLHINSLTHISNSNIWLSYCFLPLGNDVTILSTAGIRNSAKIPIITYSTTVDDEPTCIAATDQHMGITYLSLNHNNVINSKFYIIRFWKSDPEREYGDDHEIEQLDSSIITGRINSIIPITGYGDFAIVFDQSLKIVNLNSEILGIFDQGSNIKFVEYDNKSGLLFVISDVHRTYKRDPNTELYSEITISDLNSVELPIKNILYDEYSSNIIYVGNNKILPYNITYGDSADANIIERGISINPTTAVKIASIGRYACISDNTLYISEVLTDGSHSITRKIDISDILEPIITEHSTVIDKYFVVYSKTGNRSRIFRSDCSVYKTIENVGINCAISHSDVLYRGTGMSTTIYLLSNDGVEMYNIIGTTFVVATRYDETINSIKSEDVTNMCSINGLCYITTNYSTYVVYQHPTYTGSTKVFISYLLYTLPRDTITSLTSVSNYSNMEYTVILTSRVSPLIILFIKYAQTGVPTITETSFRKLFGGVVEIQSNGTPVTINDLGIFVISGVKEIIYGKLDNNLPNFITQINHESSYCRQPTMFQPSSDGGILVSIGNTSDNDNLLLANIPTTSTGHITLLPILRGAWTSLELLQNDIYVSYKDNDFPLLTYIEIPLDITSITSTDDIKYHNMISYKIGTSISANKGIVLSYDENISPSYYIFKDGTSLTARPINKISCDIQGFYGNKPVYDPIRSVWGFAGSNANSKIYFIDNNYKIINSMGTGPFSNLEVDTTRGIWGVSTGGQVLEFYTETNRIHRISTITAISDIKYSTVSDVWIVLSPASHAAIFNIQLGTQNRISIPNIPNISSSGINLLTNTICLSGNSVNFLSIVDNISTTLLQDVHHSGTCIGKMGNIWVIMDTNYIHTYNEIDNSITYVENELSDISRNYLSAGINNTTYVSTVISTNSETYLLNSDLEIEKTISGSYSMLTLDSVNGIWCGVNGTNITFLSDKLDIIGSAITPNHITYATARNGLWSISTTNTLYGIYVTSNNVSTPIEIDTGNIGVQTFDPRNYIIAYGMHDREEINIKRFKMDYITSLVQVNNIEFPPTTGYMISHVITTNEQNIIMFATLDSIYFVTTSNDKLIASQLYKCNMISWNDPIVRTRRVLSSSVHKYDSKIIWILSGNSTENSLHIFEFENGLHQINNNSNTPILTGNIGTPDELNGLMLIPINNSVYLYEVDVEYVFIKEILQHTSKYTKIISDKLNDGTWVALRTIGFDIITIDRLNDVEILYSSEIGNHTYAVFNLGMWCIGGVSTKFIYNSEEILSISDSVGAVCKNNIWCISGNDVVFYSQSSSILTPIPIDNFTLGNRYGIPSLFNVVTDIGPLFCVGSMQGDGIYFFDKAGDSMFVYQHIQIPGNFELSVSGQNGYCLFIDPNKLVFSLFDPVSGVITTKELDGAITNGKIQRNDISTIWSLYSDGNGAIVYRSSTETIVQPVSVITISGLTGIVRDNVAAIYNNV